MEKNTANIYNTHLWKADSWKSVEYYNNWFMSYAPVAFRDARKGVVNDVNFALSQTRDFTEITADRILAAPKILSVLRMVTAPPLALERLAGLSYVSRTILKTLEQGKIPRKTGDESIESIVERMLIIVRKMIDIEVFPWLCGSSITR